MNLSLDQIVFNLITNKVILEKRLKEIEETRDPFVIVTDPHDEDDNDPPKYGRIYWYVGTHLNGKADIVEFNDEYDSWTCPGNIYPMRVYDPEDPNEDRFILAEDYKTAIVTGARVREMMDFIAVHRGEPNMYLQFCNLHGPRETRDGFNDYIKGHGLKTEESEPTTMTVVGTYIKDGQKLPDWNTGPKDAQVFDVEDVVYYKVEDEQCYFCTEGNTNWMLWATKTAITAARGGPLHDDSLKGCFYRTLEAGNKWWEMQPIPSEFELVINAANNTIQMRKKHQDAAPGGENEWLG